MSQPVLASPVSAVRGLTLVEMAVAVAISAILLAVTVPSFSQLVAKMRIEGAANNLATDLQLARTESIQRRTGVSLSTNDAGTGYTIAAGATTIKSVELSSGISLSANVVVTFDPLRGLANAAAFTGSCCASSVQLRVTSDAMGRVQMCSPEGTLKGYPTC